MQKLIFILFIVFLTQGISGCIFLNNEYHYGKETIGQKLIDLENARKEGAISELEFVELKQKMLVIE